MILSLDELDDLKLSICEIQSLSDRYQEYKNQIEYIEKRLLEIRAELVRQLTDLAKKAKE